jgi:hypothetical protein
VSHGQAVTLILLGGLGAASFGGTWLAVQYLHVERLRQGDHDWLEAILGQRRRSRVNRWIRVAPLLTVIPVGLVLAGVVLRWALPA